jgi:cyclopropane fatty-acyl-phospholipid synthase-like methyltransferase
VDADQAVRVLRQHEIAEADHRILNPFTGQQLMQLADVGRVGPATRILDLACGKGEMLCRWAAAFGCGGHGVDISEVFLAAASSPRCRERWTGSRPQARNWWR